MNILFVCRGNLQRSPTAKDLLQNRTGEEVRVKSAGINRNARTRVDKNLLDWADQVYVMMDGIKKKIEEELPDSLDDKKIRVLGIADRYIRGEPRLKKKLIEKFSQDDILSKYVDESDLEELTQTEERFTQ